MLPDPLHPALVHFPIVLAVALPLLALRARFLLARGASGALAWRPVAWTHALLVIATVAALRSGHAEEERVEGLVGEARTEAHEEAGERFLVVVAGALVLTLGGLARGSVGRLARPLAALGAVGVLAAGYAVGHSGGALVYGPGGVQASSRSELTSRHADPFAERDELDERD